MKQCEAPKLLEEKDESDDDFDNDNDSLNSVERRQRR